MFKRILVPTDGSDITAKAVDTAIGLAKSRGGAAVHDQRQGAVPVQRDLRDAADAAAGVLRRAGAHRRARACRPCASRHAAGLACEAHTVEALHPWEAIIDHAKRSDCDLIVMASHGRRGVAALLLGSETQSVLIHSDDAGADRRSALQPSSGQSVRAACAPIDAPRRSPGPRRASQLRQRVAPSTAGAAAAGSGRPPRRR